MGFVLLLSFLFMIYMNPVLLTPALNADRIIQLVGIAAMIIVMARKLTSKEKLKFQWPESYLMLGLVGAAGLSCFTAVSSKLAVATTVDLAKIAIIYFLIINVADSERKIRMATLTMVAGGLFPTIGILQNYIFRTGWNGKFGGTNDLAYGLVVLVPLTIQLAREIRQRLQPLLVIVSILYTMAIFASGSQAAVFALLAALLIMGLRQSGISRRLLVLALLMETVLVSNYHWTTEVILQQPMDTVRNIAGMFSSHLILGVGLGCSGIAWLAHPGTHNTLFQALGEIGILGCVPFALLIITAFVRSNRIVRAEMRHQSAASMALGLEGSLVGFLVCGMFGGYLLSWPPYLLLGLVSALSLVMESKSTADDMVPERATASAKCSPPVLESAA